ncbi:MAG TPA: helix-turn-helix domain-containing protein, partial [Paenibacillus sp.]|nr:helix-turn-helix domain-containing protein [Paenibacillus sp.]
MTLTTQDLIGAIREDIKRELREEILSDLQPEIERRLYTNVFTFNEAAKYLKVSISTLRRMVEADEIPYFKQREHKYFRQIDLNKWIEKRLEGRV